MVSAKHQHWKMASGHRSTTSATTRFMLLPFMLILQLSLSAHAESCSNFPAIFNFGDSNSDTGGMSALLMPLSLPFGQTFFGMPVGRYSDGRLTIDFMAQSLGIPYLSAYLNSVGSNFTQGANFATSGASIARDTSPVSLDVQTWEFEQFINRSQFVYNNIGGIYRDILPKAEYFSKALYTFDIGQNDLTSGYNSNMTTEQLEAYIPDLMEKFTAVIQSVYQLGGRYFWIHNTGPIGCLPYSLVSRPDITAQKDEAGCSITYNKVAQLFNARLNETVSRLRTALPEAAFTYVDVYAAKYKLINDAKKFGFGNPLLVCCGNGGGEYNFDRTIGISCGRRIEVNGTSVLVGKSCNDPSKSVSWDGVHFTEAANKFVFNQIVNGALSDPPVPLSQAWARTAWPGASQFPGPCLGGVSLAS